jgi:ribosomal protein L11 methylase PrmA
MCLRWIARHAPQAQRVLDYGCGSGILAIGAAKFGAASVDAVDIDEAAVRSTEANARANGVQVTAGLPDRAQGRYDTVLANILATPLKVLAPLLCAHVAPGGAPGPGGHPVAPGRRTEGGLRAPLPARSERRAGRLDPDDGTLLSGLSTIAGS